MLGVCLCLDDVLVCVFASLELNLGLLLLATSRQPTIKVSDLIVNDDYRQKLMLMLLWWML